MPSNSTIYNEATTALQLLILDFKSTAAERGEMSGPTVLCEIVAGEEGLKEQAKTSDAGMSSPVSKLALAVAVAVVGSVAMTL